MANLRRIVVSAAVLILAPALSTAFELPRSAISSGAVDTAGGSFTLRATVGEAGVVLREGDGSYTLSAGFWGAIHRTLATDAPEVAEETGTILFANGLSQSFPNPFRSHAEIAFSVARDSRVRLSIFDVTGRRVATVMNQELAPGRYTSKWDGRDSSGHTASSGVYFYRLDAGDFSKTKKMIKLQ